MKRPEQGSAFGMYVLNRSKTAVPSLGENVLQRNIVKNYSFKTNATTKSQNLQNQKWSLFPVQPYRVLFNASLLEQTKNALLGFSSFKSKFLASVTQVRNFVQSSKQNQMKTQDKDGTSKPLPRLYYIQNPFLWLSIKRDFRHLRVTVDPYFSEEEFSRGVRQALSRVTQLISNNDFESMKPLFAKKALLSLRYDVENWSDEVKRNIGLEPHDIQLIIPKKLHFRNVNEKKFCDIDVICISMKHKNLEEKNGNPPVLYIDVLSRFHRNYTKDAVPEWTMAGLRLRKMHFVHPKAR